MNRAKKLLLWAAPATIVAFSAGCQRPPAQQPVAEHVDVTIADPLPVAAAEPLAEGSSARTAVPASFVSEAKSEPTTTETAAQPPQPNASAAAVPVVQNKPRAAAKPVVDRRGRPACGNVMSKGENRRWRSC